MLILLPPWRHAVRQRILPLVVIAAILLRVFGAPGLLAVILAAVFGLLGLAIMVLFSRKSGAMAHCITYCPIGLNALEYKFPGMKPTTARVFFIVTAATLHALFLAAARALS